MSTAVISAVVPAAVSRGGGDPIASTPLPRRRLPLPSLIAQHTGGNVYGLAALDDRGRLADHALGGDHETQRQKPSVSQLGEGYRCPDLARWRTEGVKPQHYETIALLNQCGSMNQTIVRLLADENSMAAFTTLVVGVLVGAQLFRWQADAVLALR